MGILPKNSSMNISECEEEELVIDTHRRESVEIPKSLELTKA